MAACTTSSITGALHSRVFSNVGKSVLLEAEPAVVHFPMAGPTGRVAKQTIRIRNRAGYSVRVTVAPPMTPFFKASFTARLGNIAPGMAEELCLEFFAQELRYYYDSLRVESEDSRMVIPIHAYPTVGAITLPSVVDFGTCSMGETATKRLALQSKLPVSFEYRITQTRQNPRFVVQPQEGFVSGSNAAELTISFSPTRFATEFATIQVNVAGFDTEPHECSLVGSCAPGLALKGFLASQATQQSAGSAPVLTETGKEDLARRDCRVQGPIAMKLPTMPPAHTGRVVDSIVFPPNLSSHALMGFVLGQTGRRQLSAKRVQTDEGLGQEGQQGGGSMSRRWEEELPDGVHALDCLHLPASLKGEIFAAQLQEATSMEQQLLLPSHNMVGQEVLDSSSWAAAQEARLRHAANHQLQQQKRAASRSAMEVDRAGPVLPTASGSTCAAPTWQLASANDWRKRRQVLQRFVCAVRKVIYQLRAQSRLNQLKRLLCDVGTGRNAGQFAQAVSAHALAMLRPGVAPSSLYHPDRVHTRLLPLHRSTNFPDFEAVRVVEYTDFDDLQLLELQVPLVSQQLGYSPEELPAYTPYIPRATASPITGAVEELRHPVPCGTAPDLSQIPAMPVSLLSCPYVNSEIGSRPFSMQVQGVAYPAWGQDVENLIQPRIFPFHDSVAHETPLSTSVRALCSTPCISDAPPPHHGLVQPARAPGLLPGPSADDIMQRSSTPACSSTPSGSQQHPAPVHPATTHGQTHAATAQSGQPPLDDKAATDPGGPQQQLPRMRRLQELDAAHRKRHLEAVQGLQDALDTYNARLSQPGKYGLQL